MTKEEIDAAIVAVESSISGLEGWVIPFAFLVAIGVAGEAVIGVKQLLNNRELKGLRINEAELITKERAALQKEVSNAKKAAADALLALQKFKAPRWPNEEQQAALISVFRRYPGMVAHFWVYPVGTPDSAPLAMLLSILMKLNGWETASWTIQSGYPSVGGVAVTWRDGEVKNMEAARAIVDTLNGAGIDALAPGPFEIDDKMIEPPNAVPMNGGANQKINVPTIRIFVGTKPQ